MASHVFVVDDDPGIAALSSLILKIEGFEVLPFTSPGEALANLADESSPNPKAIVLDLNMPGMNGRDFFRRARSMGYREPILIVSAYGAQAAKEELGAQAALEKPFDPEQLAATLRTLYPSADQSGG